jgi:hypothetical protein
MRSPFPFRPPSGYPGTLGRIGAAVLLAVLAAGWGSAPARPPARN